MSGKLSPLARWRNAVRDSDLNSTAKLVAYTIGTYMNKNGVAWPSKAKIAADASLGLRAVDAAVLRIEAAGLLQVAHSKGKHVNRYRASGAGLTAHDVRGSTAHRVQPTAHLTTPNPARRAHESFQKALRKASRGEGWIENLNDYTGARYAKGGSGGMVYDPLGKERPPDGWPYDRPTIDEIRRALEGAA